MSKSSTTIKPKKSKSSRSRRRSNSPVGPVRLPAVHPGKMIVDELKARKITQHRFAAHIKISAAYLSDIVQGRRGLSAEMAYKVGFAFGTGPEIWMNLQKQYELALIDEKKFSDIKEIA